MKRLGLMTLLACLLLSHGARAESEAPDEVTLRSGGFIRGTVVSSEPGVGVRILELGGDQARFVPWGEVADVARGKYPARPPAPLPAPIPDQPGVVRLHIDSPEPIRVFRSEYVAAARAHGAEVTFFRQFQLCVSPCDQVIDARNGNEILIEGERVEQAELSLEDKQGDQELTVVPGSPEGRAFGGITAAVGGLVLLIASPLLAAGAINNASSDDQTGPTAGVVTGGVLLLGGLVVWGFSTDGLDLHPRFRGPVLPESR